VASKLPRVLVITPTYDERENLGPFAERLFAAQPGAHLLVVDDASPDGTGQLADALARADPRVRVLHRAAKMGLGTAYVEGFREALERGYDVAVEMDTDLSHDAAELAPMLAEIARGADVVVGSRGVRGGRIEGWGPFRHAMSKGGSFYARAVLGVSEVNDMTTGFKAYTRRALAAIDVETLRSNGYAFQIETTYRALRRGLRVVEVPIVFVDRRVGRSKLSRRVFAEAVFEVLRLRADAARGRI